MALVERHPELVAGLGLVDTKSTADEEAARANRLRIADEVLATSSVEAVRGMRTTLLGATARATRPDLVETLDGWISSQPPDGVAWSQRAMAARPDRTAVLAGFAGPAAVVVGDGGRARPAGHRPAHGGRARPTPRSTCWTAPATCRRSSGPPRSPPCSTPSPAGRTRPDAGRTGLTPTGSGGCRGRARSRPRGRATRRPCRRRRARAAGPAARAGRRSVATGGRRAPGARRTGPRCRRRRSGHAAGTSPRAPSGTRAARRSSGPAAATGGGPSAQRRPGEVGQHRARAAGLGGLPLREGVGVRPAASRRRSRHSCASVIAPGERSRRVPAVVSSLSDAPPSSVGASARRRVLGSGARVPGRGLGGCVVGSPASSAGASSAAGPAAGASPVRGGDRRVLGPLLRRVRRVARRRFRRRVADAGSVAAATRVSASSAPGACAAAEIGAGRPFADFGAGRPACVGRRRRTADPAAPDVPPALPAAAATSRTGRCPRPCRPACRPRP